MRAAIPAERKQTHSHTHMPHAPHAPHATHAHAHPHPALGHPQRNRLGAHPTGSGAGGSGGFGAGSSSGGGSDDASDEVFERRLRSELSSSSKVLHVRGTPPAVTELELAALCSPYGTVVRTLILNGKQQAFVQMDTVQSAAAVVNRYGSASSPALIRSKPVFFQFSNRDEIKTNPSAQTHAQAQNHQVVITPTSTPAPGAAAGSTTGAVGGGSSVAGLFTPGTSKSSSDASDSASSAAATSSSAGSTASGASTASGGSSTAANATTTIITTPDLKTTTTASSILLVTILNTRDAVVTLEHLHQIFLPFGPVLKIVTFVKQQLFKALVELASVDAGVQAKAALEGKHMFQDSCRLRIGFSTLTELKVARNSTRSRDFTLPPPGSFHHTHAHAHAHPHAHAHAHGHTHGHGHGHGQAHGHGHMHHARAQNGHPQALQPLSQQPLQAMPMQALQALQPMQPLQALQPLQAQSSYYNPHNPQAAGLQAQGQASAADMFLPQTLSGFPPGARFSPSPAPFPNAGMNMGMGMGAMGLGMGMGMSFATATPMTQVVATPTPTPAGSSAPNTSLPAPTSTPPPAGAGGGSSATSQGAAGSMAGAPPQTGAQSLSRPMALTNVNPNANANVSGNARAFDGANQQQSLSRSATSAAPTAASAGTRRHQNQNQNQNSSNPNLFIAPHPNAHSHSQSNARRPPRPNPRSSGPGGAGAQGNNKPDTSNSPSAASTGGAPSASAGGQAPLSSSGVPPSASAASAATFAAGGPGCVLLINRLPSAMAVPDHLFTLFGVYGDVVRVKILFKKTDTALIQFATAQQAHLALLHLNRLSIHGSELTIAVSKYNEIALPARITANPNAPATPGSLADPSSSGSGAGGADSPNPGVDSNGNGTGMGTSNTGGSTVSALTRDYTTSKIHRFTRSGRNARNINPPSRVLHVSNLPDGATEAQLKKLFGSDLKFSEPAVQFFQSNRKQSFVRMASVNEAVVALINKHNVKFGDRYLRVSFSSKDANAVVDSDPSQAGTSAPGSANASSGPTSPDTPNGTAVPSAAPFIAADSKSAIASTTTNVVANSTGASTAGTAIVSSKSATKTGTPLSTATPPPDEVDADDVEGDADLPDGDDN